MANPDDEPMWAADRVVAPTPGPTITIPATANEFAIKGNHLTLVDMEELMAEHMDEHNMVVQSIVEHDMNEQDMNDSILNDVVCSNSKNIKDDLSGLDKAIGAVLGHRTIECNQLLVSIAKSKLSKFRDEKKMSKVTKPEELNTADLSDLLSSRRDRKEEEVALSEECEVKTLAFRAERQAKMGLKNGSAAYEDIYMELLTLITIDYIYGSRPPETLLYLDIRQEVWSTTVG
ncbi:hypothetical protein Tco_0073775 [Tanacetum coccineum]